jgi:hypothetical protein
MVCCVRLATFVASISFGDRSSAEQRSDAMDAANTAIRQIGPLTIGLLMMTTAFVMAFTSTD